MSIIDKILGLSDLELSRFTKSDEDMETLRKYFKAIKRSVGASKTAFKRADEYSHALDRYLEEAAKRPNIPLEQMSRHRLIAEIASFKKFKGGETSTVEGVRKVNREQDKRIFGTDSSGRPLRTMTQDERREYWRVYDEWENAYRRKNPDLSSSQVQYNLQELMFNNPTVFGQALLADKLEMLTKYAREQKQEIDRTGFGPNVFSGRGNDF